MERFVTKKNIIITACIFVLLIGGIITANILARQSQLAVQPSGDGSKITSKDAKEVCTTDQITRANAALTAQPTDYVALDKVVNEITATADSQYDVNCLYILIQHDISRTDTAKGREHADILKGLYGGAVSYSPLFTQPQSPSFLDDTVKDQEDDAGDFTSQEGGIGDSPQDPAGIDVDDSEDEK